MMDRNREARRAAAMANGLPRRRHRTTTSGSLRESPEDESQLELQETAARLRDRTVKKERDRDLRDRDNRDHRERERDRLSRTKRRRGDKYREDGGGGGDDDSSEESVNDEDEEDDDGGRVRYVPPPSNHVPMSSTTPASTLTSHRKSYPPPSKMFRVAPAWKAPDEMIGVSIPRKARSASTKRGHDCWSSVGGVTGEVSRQPSTSPVRSQTVAGGGGGGVSVPSPSPSPSPAPPISPSSSNVSIKKKIKVNNNGFKQQRPPKPSSKSSPSIQDEIEIEVAEVLYGLKRQSQPPPKQPQDGLPNDSTKLDSRSSTADSKFRVSSPVLNNHAPPLTTVAPKRKRPRPYPEENQGSGPRSSPIPASAKAETDQATKMEAASPSVEKSLGLSGGENGGVIVNLQDITVDNNGGLSDVKEGLVEESGGIRSEKVEEASSSPKLESPQNNDRVESSTTSTKPNSALGEPENHREEKFEIDLMAPPQTSPEREEEMAEYSGGDEKTMLTDKETEGQTILKPKEEDDDNKGVKSNNKGDVVEVNSTKIVEDNKQLKCEVSNSKLNLNASNFDLEKSSVNVNEEDKLIFQKQQPKTTRDDASTDNMPGGGQSGTAPLPMSVPGGWHGGIAPMGYVGPLQGVVSMDGTPMASPPIQSPHFLFSQPKPKRCATHCYIARSISVHQQMLKMNPFWPAAAGTAPLFNGKPYNLNMVPPPTDLHATGRGVVVNSSQDNKQGQPFTFFSGQPTPSSKDKSPQPPTLPDSAQKQFLLQPALPPGAPSNILHAPALFFPMGQQQPAVPNVRPGSTKSQSTSGATTSTSTPTSAPMGTASNAGPGMSFSYPSMGGNETQFMAILGNSAYPFPIPAHVGAASPYRGTHPQAMPFFNGSFYSSQMLHPSQLQQQAAQTSQSMQLQQHNQPNPSLSTASSSSQKHLQNQQMRPQGSTTTPASGNSTQGGLQNFQASKGRTSQSHDIGGEGSPSTGDGRTRQNMSVYGQNFAMPFTSPNFALMTSGGGGGGNNASVVSNGNLGDKKQQQPQQNPAFPMSFATINGTTPGLDMSSIAQNHAIIMSLPEAARQNYQIISAQAAQHKKNSYRSPEDGKTGGSGSVTDTSNVDEERKAMAMRASAGSVGQSIAFSRDLSDNSTSGVPGNTVVDSSARSMNLVHGSYTRPSRSPGQNSVSASNTSNPSQQMLFPKQQQYVAPPSASSGRTKTPSTNGNVYPDHLGSPSIMAAKFPNSLSGFPPLVQTSVAPAQSTQWKNSVRPNTSQVSSPSIATSTTSTMKNLPQQPGRSQQNHTQISFGPTGTTPKASSTQQGQQTQNNQSPSPMMVGSPSTSSVSKGASGSPRTTTSASTGNKAGGQGSTLSSQQGKSSQSPSLSSQKQSILGSPHHIMSSSSNSGVKPQIQQSQLQAQFSKQNLQQAQLYFSSFMQPASATTSAAMAMAYTQRHRPDTSQQAPGSGSKSQGSAGPITSSSGMLSLCSQVSGVNTSTSDPAKAANNMKGSLNSQGVLQVAAQFAAQSGGGTHQLMNAGFPYVHAVPNAVQVKSAEQKQPTGE